VSNQLLRRCDDGVLRDVCSVDDDDFDNDFLFRWLLVGFGVCVVAMVIALAVSRRQVGGASALVTLICVLCYVAL
jgi:hypothetical protein